MRQIRKKIKSLGSLWVRLERPEGRKMLENALVPRESIDEIVGRRTQSLELFQQGYAMIRSAREMAGRAAPNGYLPTFPDNIKYMLESCSERNESDCNAGVTKPVDKAKNVKTA